MDIPSRHIITPENFMEFYNIEYEDEFLYDKTHTSKLTYMLYILYCFPNKVRFLPGNYYWLCTKINDKTKREIRSINPFGPDYEHIIHNSRSITSLLNRWRNEGIKYGIIGFSLSFENPCDETDYTKEMYGHMNLIIFDLENKEFTYHNPHGMVVNEYEMHKLVSHFSKMTNYKFVYDENDEDFVSLQMPWANDTIGRCIAFSYIYLYLKLGLNDDRLSEKRVNKYFFETLEIDIGKINNFGDKYIKFLNRIKNIWEKFTRENIPDDLSYRLFADKKVDGIGYNMKYSSYDMYIMLSILDMQDDLDIINFKNYFMTS